MKGIPAFLDQATRLATSALGRITNPFALPAWLPELRNREVLRADAIAGVTVALILIPQSMAYAQLAGLPAHYGLYAALVPPVVAAFFGSSRQLATGPVAMVSLMTAGALAPLAAAGSEAYVGYAVLLALMVGVFQLLLGMFRLGVLLNFLSHPVVQGFVNAAAIIIATSQLGKIFGVEAERGHYHIEYVVNTVRAAADHTHWPTVGMAVLAFATMYGVRRYYPRLPYVLIAVFVTTVLAWLMGFEQHRTVRLDQISDRSIRVSLTFDALQRKYIANQEAEYIALQREFGRVADDAGTETADLLDQRQVLEQSEFLLRQLKEKSRAYHEELFARPLYAVGEGEDVTFYTREELRALGGEERKIYGQDWHVVSYENNVVELQAGGAVIGSVPRGLPGFSLPPLDGGAIRQLIGAMIAISLLGFMEAISVARAMASRTRQPLDANRELIGQGLGNIAGSMFLAYPSSGSFSRSAVNFDSGAVTGFSSVVAVVVVGVTLLLLTPLLYYLPQATLAAVIMIAVGGLINLKPLLHAWRTNRHDGIVGVLTFVFTLLLAPDLEMGILLGLLLSLALLLYRMMKPRIVFPPHPRFMFPPEAVDAGALDDGRIVRMRFDGSLLFVNVSLFEEQLQRLLAARERLEVLIIDWVAITDIDASGEEMLRENVRRLQEAGVDVIMTRIRAPIMDVFRRSHLFGDIDEGCFQRELVDAYARAWDRVAANAAAADGVDAAPVPVSPAEARTTGEPDDRQPESPSPESGHPQSGNGEDRDAQVSDPEDQGHQSPDAPGTESPRP